MTDAANVLSAWQSFYVIVGSSGGALIGLQFVVITLLAARRHLATPGTLSAFGTPTVVHLAGALLVSAIMSAPWPAFGPLSVALGFCGLGGLVYSALAIHRARHQSGYQPVWEDWLWYSILPCFSYAALTVTALLLGSPSDLPPFVIAAVALGLLFIGIHNAWDSVTHIVVSGVEESVTRSNEPPSAAP